MYHYGKHFNTKDELIKAIDDWIYYYINESKEDSKLRHHMKFKSNHYLKKTLKQYPISENKRIIKYQLEHYRSSSTLTA